MRYTTYGSVRGCCGHIHASPETAERCIERDQAGCAQQGGYSDRRVVGDDYTYSERCAIGAKIIERLA